MKLKVIYTVFSILLLSVLFVGFQNGPAGGDAGNGPRGDDRTGSPFTTSNTTCAGCHNTGSFNPGITIELLDGEEAVTEYVGGQTYTLRILIEANAGSPSGYGSQSVVLADSDDSNAGTFGDPGADRRVEDVNGRMYFEHTMLNSSNEFSIDWTAPEAGTGAVTVYAGGVAANGNNTTAGDNAAMGTLTLSETITAIRPQPLAGTQVKLLQNPVVDQLGVQINSDRQVQLQLNILGMNGQQLQRRSLGLNTGEQTEFVDMADLPSGVYIMQLTDGKGVSAHKIVKQ